MLHNLYCYVLVCIVFVSDVYVLLFLLIFLFVNQYLNYSAINYLYFISNFITNQIISCFYCSYEAVLTASAADFLAWSRNFSLYLPLKFYLHFYQYFCSCFYQKTKIHCLLQVNIPMFNWIACHFYMLHVNWKLKL